MKRLLEEPLSGRAASLLRSAAVDVPPNIDQEKARLRAEVAAAVSSQAPRGLASAKWLWLLALATAGVVGAGYGLSFMPGAHGGTPASESPAVSSGEAKPNGIATRANAPPPPPTEPPPASVDVMALPSAPADHHVGGAAARVRPATPKAPAERSAASGATTATANAEAPSLEDELAALDEARAATVEQHPALALRQIESYRRRFPAGSFAAEVDALELQALAAVGRNEEARAKAERFLSQHPDSPYAQRIRSVVNVEQ